MAEAAGDMSEMLADMLAADKEYEESWPSRRPPNAIVAGDLDDGEQIVAPLSDNAKKNFGTLALEALRRTDIYGDEQRPTGL